jgi:hypothetical protein
VAATITHFISLELWTYLEVHFTYKGASVLVNGGTELWRMAAFFGSTIFQNRPGGIIGRLSVALVSKRSLVHD